MQKYNGVYNYIFPLSGYYIYSITFVFFLEQTLINPQHISSDLHSCSSVYTLCPIGPITSQTLTLGLKFRGSITNYIINQYKCLTSHFFQFIYNKVTDKHKRLLYIRLFKEIFPTCFLFYFAKYILRHPIYRQYIIQLENSFQNISLYIKKFA